MKSPPLRLCLTSLLGSLLLVACFPDFPADPPGSAAGGAGNVGGAGGASGPGGAGGAEGPGGSGGSGASGAGASGQGGSSGASPASLGKGCMQDSECPDLVCRFGYCRFPCTQDGECGLNTICLSDQSRTAMACSLPGDGDACAQGSCPNGDLTCGIDGRCRTGCDSENSCNFKGQDCIAHTCVSALEDNFGQTWGSCSPEGVSCGGAEGKTISYCNVKAPGVVLGESCETTDLCAAGIKISPPSCAPTGCAEGAFRCTTTASNPQGPATLLQKCNLQKTGYEDVDTCASAALCLKGLQSPTPACAAAGCGPMATPPTDTNRCHDGDAETCDGAVYSTAVPCDGQQCNPATATCFALVIDDTEVTRGDYEAFLTTAPSQTGFCKDNNKDLHADADCMKTATDCTPTADDDCSTHPQVCVDWCDAKTYCEVKGKSLCGTVGKPADMVPLADFYKPGVSLWMNACSSGGQYTWTHGNTWDMNTEGQYCDGASKAKGPAGNTFAVGTLDKCHSPVAAYKSIRDLSGSVAEWENSCARLDTSPDASPNDNCRIRGGSFDDSLGGKSDLRCDADVVRPRNTVSPYIGFRCCGM